MEEDIYHQLFGKDPDAGKDRRQWGKKRGWQRTPWLDSITDTMDMNLSKRGNSGGQRSLVCGSPWGHKESDTT